MLIGLTDQPDLVHVAHSDGGVEDVVKAARGGLEAGGGEAGEILGNVIPEKEHSQSNAEQHDEAPQRPPLLSESSMRKQDLQFKDDLPMY